MTLHPPYLDQNPAHREAIAETVDLICRELAPRSVLDCGCNSGDWLRGFLDAGIYDVLGLDLPHMEEHLLIPSDFFMSMDLCTPFDLDRQFDLVLCLEVGEHLPENMADTLLDNLIAHGDTILFSAAVPGQGGHGHINEQPFNYWREKFADRGYTADVSIRDRLPESLVWWYRRNMAVLRA